ncbi:hypothetical protein EMIT0158MI4_20080 [Burkholderia ambifaria]
MRSAVASSAWPRNGAPWIVVVAFAPARARQRVARCGSRGGRRIPVDRRAGLARRATRAERPGSCLRRLWHGSQRFVEGADEL